MHSVHRTKAFVFSVLGWCQQSMRVTHLLHGGRSQLLVGGAYEDGWHSLSRPRVCWVISWQLQDRFGDWKRWSSCGKNECIRTMPSAYKLKKNMHSVHFHKVHRIFANTYQCLGFVIHSERMQKFAIPPLSDHRHMADRIRATHSTTETTLLN